MKFTDPWVTVVLAAGVAVSLVGLGATLGYAAGADATRQATVPVALRPVADTTVIYRTLVCRERP